MKFRYCIVDLVSREVFQTDSVDTCEAYLSEGDYLVIDNKNRFWHGDKDWGQVKELD